MKISKILSYLVERKSFTNNKKHDIMLMVYFNILKYMIYTNKFINLISLFLTIFIFLIIYSCFFNKNIPIRNISNLIPETKIIKEDSKDELKDENFNQEKVDLGNWYIEIPAISLTAPIAEGTEADILNDKVGHFIDTSSEFGNIGLAAHNRGYKKNYFQNLKKLKKEDQIIYTHDSFKKVYSIDKIEIIENTDWSYLKNTDENKITLITCIENEPKYRRCVQGTEFEN